MDRLKIALLCNGYGRVKRGSERYTEELFNHFSDIFDIDIYGVGETNRSFGVDTKFRDDIKIPWRNGRAYLESWYFGEYVYRHLHNGRYDLVLNNAGFPCSYWCNKIRKKTGVPFIVFERGGGREEGINNWFNPDKIVYLTEYSYDKSRYCKKAYLPVGIDTEAYQKKRTPPFFMEELEHPVFLSTSALVGFKRIPLVIDAVSMFGRGTLLQTSDGNLKGEICKYGIQELGDRFQYVGKVSSDVLMGFYQHSDYFLSASEHEAFGIVYLEAMASGLPVISQEDERRREIIGAGGYLLDCKDTLFFADVLKHLCKKDFSPLEQVKQFDWKVLKPRYVKVMEEVVG